MTEIERQPFYIGVKGVITEGESIFAVRDKVRDKWELPGGLIDKGQTIMEAFAKELDEEVPGAELFELGETIHEAIGDFEVENGLKLYLVFKLATVALPPSVTLGEEHSEAALITPTTIDDFDLYASDREAMIITFDRMAV